MGRIYHWCLLSCKDTNFKANHNNVQCTYLQYKGVCYLAKIRILKQITTTRYNYLERQRCLLSCKDTNFKANHNEEAGLNPALIGVCYLAKIRILKQITTRSSLMSKFKRCLLSCKDTNFKANHNDSFITMVTKKGVCYLAKIRILKQITT